MKINKTFRVTAHLSLCNWSSRTTESPSGVVIAAKLWLLVISFEVKVSVTLDLEIVLDLNFK